MKLSFLMLLKKLNRNSNFGFRNLRFALLIFVCVLAIFFSQSRISEKIFAQIQSSQDNDPFSWEIKPENISPEFLDRWRYKSDTLTQQDAVAQKQVRIIYLAPADKPIRSDYKAAAAEAILHLQNFYKNELDNNYAFSLTPSVVEAYQTTHTASWYSTNQSRPGASQDIWFWENALADGSSLTGGRFDDPNNRWIYYIDADPACRQIIGGTNGVALLSANDFRGLTGEQNIPRCSNEPPDNGGKYRWIGGLGHELGHAFGLPHPPGCDQGSCQGGQTARDSLMWSGYANYPNTYFLPDDKQKLLNTGFFYPTNCVFSLSSISQSFNSAGGNDSFTVNTETGCTWTATSNANWITLTGGSSGSGNGTVFYSVQQNTSTMPRSGIITAGGQTFTVNQSASISVTVNTHPSGLSFTVDGTTYTSAQTFNWTPGSNHTIATASTQNGSAGTRFVWNNWSDDGTISHTVSPTSNTTYSAIFTTQYQLTTVANPGNGGSSSPPSGNWYNASQSVQISASPSGGYTFSSWSGSGNGSYSGANNPANITMNSPITQTANFTQTQNSVIQFSASNYSVNENGGTATITVTRTGGTNPVSLSYATSNGTAVAGSDYNSANGTLNFASGETSKNFNVSIINDSSAEGDETVNLTLTNPTGGATLGSPITAVLTIIDNDSCSYNINPTGSEPSPSATSGNSITVTAPAGCQWTTSTTDSWITITAGSSGSGNGTLIYSVAANSGAARAGTITVAGKTFAVLQNSGFPCSFTPISYGETVSGNFSSSDCSFFGHYNDGYTFSGTAGDRIILSSSFPDTNLQLHSNATGIVNLTSAANGSWFYTLPTTSAYTLYTSPSAKFNQPGGAGSYTLSLTKVNQARTLFDYDGDGKADISLFRPSLGSWYLLRSSNGSFFGLGFGLGTDIIAPADYDGDGKTDFTVFRPSNGTWYLQQSANGFTAVQFGQSGDIPVPADYDGDGKADIAVFRPSTGGWYRYNSSDGGFVGVGFGISEDKPTIGDFDGDGKSDIAVFRPSTASWFRLNSSNGQFVAVQFGTSEDKPTPADYDGDGKADIAVFRPSTGGWYRYNSSDGGFVAVSFGTPEDKPVAADYDGDGKADIAVFRPSLGTWYLLRSTSGFTAVQFGQANDKPVPNAFIR